MTAHTFEQAPSGRSKCRGCGAVIGKGEVRFGERLPNPFGDGDMTHWLHPLCAAHRRPESFLEAIEAIEAIETLDFPLEDADELRSSAQRAVAHHRLQRLGNAERASSNRARCRHCRELIDKGAWRLPLIFFEDDTYNSSGFIHASCVRDYVETDEHWPTVACFAQALAPDELTSLREACS